MRVREIYNFKKKSIYIIYIYRREREELNNVSTFKLKKTHAAHILSSKGENLEYIWKRKSSIIAIECDARERVCVWDREREKLQNNMPV